MTLAACKPLTFAAERLRRARRAIRMSGPSPCASGADASALDDRLLDDIGITRAEAEFLSCKPFWRE
jgi:hypothetical protein